MKAIPITQRCKSPLKINAALVANDSQTRSKFMDVSEAGGKAFDKVYSKGAEKEVEKIEDKTDDNKSGTSDKKTPTETN